MDNDLKAKIRQDALNSSCDFLAGLIMLGIILIPMWIMCCY